MTDYSKLSDDEINHLVAHIRGPEWVTPGGGEVAPYCSKWALTGPIIQEYGIELVYDGISWMAACRWRDIPMYDDWKNYPESPLRLALIIFLMLKDAENGQ